MIDNSIKYMLLACVAAVSLLSSSASTVVLAQQTTVTKSAEQSKADWVEARIAKLHDELHVIATQEAAWNDVAQSMRDSATSMKGLIDKWASQAATMSAVDSLRMHGEMAEEHAKGMRKLIPSFEKLYNTMPDSQKKIADKVFAETGERKKSKGKK